MCGAGRTKDLTDSKEEGGSLRFQTRCDFLLKGEARRRKGVLDFPSKKILGQEDTAGVEIHIEVATIGAFEENFYSSDRKLRLGLSILIR